MVLRMEPFWCRFVTVYQEVSYGYSGFRSLGDTNIVLPTPNKLEYNSYPQVGPSSLVTCRQPAVLQRQGAQC